jgi:uncharacterized membrane protein YoaK (UPF0700 family)
MVVLCILPQNLYSFVYLLPLFFMMSTQWSVFHGIGEYNSSTIFSTNNLRQMTISLTEYYLDGKTDEKKLHRGKFFANSLLWYHIGVAYSYFAYELFAQYAILAALPLTIGALALTIEAKEPVAVPGQATYLK